MAGVHTRPRYVLLPLTSTSCCSYPSPRRRSIPYIEQARMADTQAEATLYSLPRFEGGSLAVSIGAVDVAPLFAGAGGTIPADPVAGGPPLRARVAGNCRASLAPVPRPETEAVTDAKVTDARAAGAGDEPAELLFQGPVTLSGVRLNQLDLVRQLSGTVSLSSNRLRVAAAAPRTPFTASSTTAASSSATSFPASSPSPASSTPTPWSAPAAPAALSLPGSSSASAVSGPTAGSGLGVPTAVPTATQNERAPGGAATAGAVAGPTAADTAGAGVDTPAVAGVGGAGSAAPLPIPPPAPAALPVAPAAPAAPGLGGGSVGGMGGVGDRSRLEVDLAVPGIDAMLNLQRLSANTSTNASTKGDSSTPTLNHTSTATSDTLQKSIAGTSSKGLALPQGPGFGARPRGARSGAELRPGPGASAAAAAAVGAGDDSHFLLRCGDMLLRADAYDAGAEHHLEASTLQVWGKCGAVWEGMRKRGRCFMSGGR